MYCRYDCSFSFAERAITAMGVGYAIGQVDFQDDRAAMATGSMMGLNVRIPNLFEHCYRLSRS
jgi:hypothetical protein